MEDYSRIRFIQAFTQLPCEVSYAKVLLTDDKSQVAKGWETMKLDIVDGLLRANYSKM